MVSAEPGILESAPPPAEVQTTVANVPIDTAVFAGTLKECAGIITGDRPLVEQQAASTVIQLLLALS